MKYSGVGKKLVCTVVEPGAEFVVKDCGFEDQVFGLGG